MADIELRLRTAMHDAVDGEESAPEELITIVKRRHRRHLARLAGAAVVAAVAIVVPTVIAFHGKSTSSGAGPLNHAESPMKPRNELPAKLTGLPMPAGKNFEVLNATATGAAWYSTATHTTKPIAGLPAVEGGYQFNRVNGGWAASPTNYSAPCNTSVCAGPPTTFYFIAEGSLTATRIGVGYNGDGVDPGTGAGTVWLVTYPSPMSSLFRSSFAQLVSTAGRPLGPRYRLPANYLMGRGIGRYLLLDLNTNQTEFELWDPRTSRVLGHFDNVVAQGPEQIIWSRGCARCQLLVTNVATGKTVTTPIPAPQQNNLNATVSDDGRWLAAQLPSGELAVLNTVTLSLIRIPGTALNNANTGLNGNFEYFGWQNGGHRLLVFAGPNIGPGADQLAYWQPGDSHLYVETIRNPIDMEQLQTGSE